MRAFKTLLILSHRYIGIPLSFLFVIWFASAFVMIYAGGMPRVTPAMRIERASSLVMEEVKVSPWQAVGLLGYSPFEAKLRTLLDRPVYEFPEVRAPSTFIWADTGEFLDSMAPEQGARIASDFLGIPVAQFTYTGLLTVPDQWTIATPNELPLYQYVVADAYGTEVYVSPMRAEVTVYTTRQSRILAWLGTIPHWFYFAELRANQPLWYNIVVWTSGIGCILALLGLVMSVTQLRKVRPFNLRKAIPYRGMMRWHYILGTVFGIFILTWAFSGLLSMEPFAWTNARGLAVDEGVFQEGILELESFPTIDADRWRTMAADQGLNGDIKEVEFRWIGGEPYYLANYSNSNDVNMSKRDRLHQPYYIIGQLEAGSLLVNAREFRIQDGFDIDSLVAKLDASIEDAKVTAYDLLSEYDDYYYSRGNQLPLPILRIKFDDPEESWIYVDPRKSELLSIIHKYSRIERWLYSGLHSLDFAFWYHRRPLWDAGMIILLAGGLVVSLIGLWFGLTRMKNDIRLVYARLSLHKNKSQEVPSVSH
jgi:hypothetical protein